MSDTVITIVGSVIGAVVGTAIGLGLGYGWLFFKAWWDSRPKPIYKLYCVVSKEAIKKMGGNRGKMIAQGGHAYLHAWWDSMFRHPIAAWSYKARPHAYKIALVVETDAELEAIYERYKRVCGATKVIDAGFTVFEGPTLTCVGIGPLREDKKGDDLKALKVFS